MWNQHPLFSIILMNGNPIGIWTNDDSNGAILQICTGYIVSNKMYRYRLCTLNNQQWTLFIITTEHEKYEDIWIAK